MRPICLPSAACGGGRGPEAACLTGRTALIAGWGLLRQDSLDYPDVALQVRLPVLSNEQCAGDYADEPFTITSNMVCAGLPEGGKDTCQVSRLQTWAGQGYLPGEPAPDAGWARIPAR